MKKFIIISMLLWSCSGIQAQPSRTDDRYEKRVQVQTPPETVPVQPGPAAIPKNPENEDIIGLTWYDLQTNGSVQNRLILHPDGTLSAAWTLGNEYNLSYPDRGTGYNYFNGNGWLTAPSSRIETERTGWPSINPWNGNGEIVIAHNSGPTLIMNTCPEKGTGVWTQKLAPVAPSGAPGLAWSRVITSGAGNLNIHVLCLTLPAGSGGALYHGLDGALLYWRSRDGGVSWDINGIQLPGLTSDHYDGFSADLYAWGLPHGDTIYFCAGGPFSDTFIMKSTDNGTSWVKIPILSNAHAKIPSTVSYLPPWKSSDGSMACELGPGGIFHFVSGIGGGSVEGGDKYIRQYLNGLLYWNSTMQMLPDSLNLDTLYDRGQLAGWYEDGPNPGDTLKILSSYRGGLCSHPQLSIREDGDMFLLYDQVTYANPEPATDLNYRHIFANSRIAGSGNWTSVNGTDLMEGNNYSFLEFSFPCMIKNVPPEVSPYPPYIPPGYICRVASRPGLTYASSQPVISQIRYCGDSYVGGKKMQGSPDYPGQNYPNPASEETSINLHLYKAEHVVVEVNDPAGLRLLSFDHGLLPAGNHRLIMKVSTLPPGLYFYTLKTGETRQSLRMIIR